MKTVKIECHGGLLGVLTTDDVRTNGRPVEFSMAMWMWIFSDTKPTDPVEMVKGKIVVTWFVTQK